jgi:hypothetical protein
VSARRRDTAIPGPNRRSRTIWIVAAVVILVVLPLIWMALQTLGGHSSKHGAVALTRTF